MADNYLEKQMEDYRNGRLAKQYRRQTTPSGTPAGVVSFALPVKSVVVAIDNPAWRDAVVRRFASVGCRTAFFGSDRKEGSAAAQKSGALFVPVNSDNPDPLRYVLDVIAYRWSSLPDMIISDRQLPSRTIPGAFINDEQLLSCHIPVTLISPTGDVAPPAIVADPSADAEKLATAAIFAVIMPDAIVNLVK